ncbi:MAG: hypothetical protein CVT61_01915 [Actinobacteria bacterium HGW-Actinobacteria-11]|nr:MAG: hypothetical protein CVT61_01915 [Actinobacteria bacterium HGW-Actinobacteria-11]
MKRSQKILVASAAVTGTAVVGLIFALATQPDLIAPGKATHWMVTYEVETDPVDALTDTTVTYRTQENPEGRASDVDAEGVEPSGMRGDESAWFGTGKVMAQEPAKMTVTPPADVSARCRISVDAGVELTAKKGLPGETIVCEVKTPEWNNGLLGRLRIG